MNNGHNDAIFSEKDVKELSENLSRVFCKFVNTKIGDNNMLRKYIDNYKALLHLPIFLEMQAEIERLKEHLDNKENDDNDNEEHIKLEVEETETDDGGAGDAEVGGRDPSLLCLPPYEEEEVVEDVVTDGEEEEVEVTDDEEVKATDDEEEGGAKGTSGKGGHLPPEEEVEVTEEEEVEVTDDEEEVEVTDDEEEVEVTDDEEEVEVEVTEEEEEGGHLPPEEGGTEGTSGKGGHLPPEEEEEEEEEEEMFLIEIEDGTSYYTNDPDGESGDIYECLEDEEMGEHIGTITDGEISLF
jgi:hypothetical protein